MLRCYIALGSNLEQPLQQVDRAVEALAQLPHSVLVAVSPYYRSSAVGPGEQPDYINAVAALDTELAPLALLEALQAIELRQGRVRQERWGARTLDLDLLLYGDRQIDLPQLTVPHPRMLERGFVLWPLLDLAPRLCAPDGRPLSAIAGSCGSEGLWLVSGHSSPTIACNSEASVTGATTKTNAGDPQ